MDIEVTSNKNFRGRGSKIFQKCCEFSEKSVTGGRRKGKYTERRIKEIRLVEEHEGIEQRTQRDSKDEKVGMRTLDTAREAR